MHIVLLEEADDWQSSILTESMSSARNVMFYLHLPQISPKMVLFLLSYVALMKYLDQISLVFSLRSSLPFWSTMPDFSQRRFSEFLLTLSWTDQKGKSCFSCCPALLTAILKLLLTIVFNIQDTMEIHGRVINLQYTCGKWYALADVVNMLS